MQGDKGGGMKVGQWVMRQMVLLLCQSCGLLQAGTSNGVSWGLCADLGLSFFVCGALFWTPLPEAVLAGVYKAA